MTYDELILFTISFTALIVGISSLFLIRYHNDKDSKMKGMIEIFKLLSAEDQRESRRKVFEASRNKQIDENGKILDSSYSNHVEKVRSTLDLVGAMVKNGYVPKDECLDMFMGIIIRAWKALEKNIEYDRKIAGNHFKLDFEWLSLEAKGYWKKKYPTVPEPELF